MQGSIEVAGDQDWFRAELRGGTTYRITADVVADDPDFIFIEAQSRVDNEIPGGGFGDGGRIEFDIAGSLVFTPRLDGTQYISIGGLTGPGTYTLEIVEQPDDYADNADTTGRLVPGGTLEGRFEVVGDEDWFRAELTGGTTYRLDLTGAAVDALAAGLSVEDAEFAGGLFRVEPFGFTPLQDATYYFALTPDGRTGPYTVTLTEVADDFADTEATAGRLELGRSTPARIDMPEDEDWFRASLTAGTTYRIEAAGAGFDPSDLLLFQRAATGDLLDTAVTLFGSLLGGSEGQLVFTPSRSDDYFISVLGVGGTGDYTVSLAVQPDDFADNFQTTGRVSPGGSGSGVLETRDDADWFIAELRGGVTYRAELVAASADAFDFAVSAESVVDAALPDQGAGRLEIEFGPEVVFTPRVDGPYAIQVSSFASTGAYTLSLTGQADDFADNADTAGRIAPGQTVNAVHESASDEDWFRAELRAGTTYSVTADSAGEPDFPDIPGFPTFGIELFAESGEDGEFPGEQLRFEGVGNGLVFTPLEDSVYFVQVQAAGSEGAYSVTLETVSDDFPDTAATAGRLPVDGAVPPSGLSAGDAQAIALLYEAGLGRPAAFLGLNFWIDRFEAGNSLVRIAQSFLDCGEFAATVGDPRTLSDAALINGLFENVIGRPPAQGGFDFWTGRLADGASRAETLLAFATVPENAAQSPEVLTLRPIGNADGPDRDPDDRLQADPTPEWDFAG